MAEIDQGRAKVEAPRGMYSGRLDDRGRCKLAVDLQTYLNAEPEKKLFVTSLDRVVASIYPIRLWRENEAFFDSYMDNPTLASDVAFNATDLGSETEMDSQGRVLFSPELRRELNMEDQPLRLYVYRGRIDVLNETVYQQRRRGGQQVDRNALGILQRAGLK